MIYSIKSNRIKKNIHNDLNKRGEKVSFQLQMFTSLIMYLFIF
jgi:hypothetical protein